MTTQVAVAGATGKMGRMVITALRASDLDLAAAIARPGDPMLGVDAGVMLGEAPMGVFVSDDLGAVVADIDVLIDFTLPEVSLSHAELCAEHHRAMVVGTTGFSSSQRDELDKYAQQSAMCVAANFSTGVTVLVDLLKQTAAALGNSADIEIVETHHRDKIDAPSGTALAMGEAIAVALGRDLETVSVHGREGRTGSRDRHAIGFSAIRGGDVVGDHTVLFAAEGERLELTHKASSRSAFARGAVRAAGWLANKRPGRYNMRDVLGLRSSDGE